MKSRFATIAITAVVALIPSTMLGGVISGVSITTNPVLTVPNAPYPCGGSYPACNSNNWVTGTDLTNGVVTINLAQNALFDPSSPGTFECQTYGICNPFGGATGPLTAVFSITGVAEGDQIYACAVANYGTAPDCSYNNFAPLYQGWAPSGDTVTYTNGRAAFFTTPGAAGATDGTFDATLVGTTLTVTHNPPAGSSSGTIATYLILEDVGSPAPEPGSIALFGSGLAGLVMAVRRRRA